MESLVAKQAEWSVLEDASPIFLSIAQAVQMDTAKLNSCLQDKKIHILSVR